MLKVFPFRAIRPRPELAEQVAALPYDVMNTAEAREMVKDNPVSFLRIDRAEINLPEDVDPHDDSVYLTASELYKARKADGTFIQDEMPCYYLYRLTMGGRSQTGIVCCPSAEDYRNGLIKKHELTRADKEEDRVRHIDALDANTGPIFLAHRSAPRLEALTDGWARSHEALYGFDGPGGVRHEAWIVDDPDTIDVITQIFAEMDSLYIADGHHRCASAARVSAMRRDKNPGHDGSEEYERFLAVVFPEGQLRILDYNRIVSDLGGISTEGFLQGLGTEWTVTEESSPVRPVKSHEFGLCLAVGDGDVYWYRLNYTGAIPDDDPVACLDVSILQDKLLDPVLGIKDLRLDKRIDFVGGIRGIEELEKRVKRDMAAAFALYPTRMEELIAIADAGEIMPPKSTWFEPKLLSGLFIHELDV